MVEGRMAFEEAETFHRLFKKEECDDEDCNKQCVKRKKGEGLCYGTGWPEAEYRCVCYADMVSNQ